MDNTELKYADNLKVFSIYDGGEYFWYIDTSSAEALKEHIMLNYIDAGVSLKDSDIDENISELPPNKLLKIDDDEKTAELWAQLEGRGLLGATVY